MILSLLFIVGKWDSESCASSVVQRYQKQSLDTILEERHTESYNQLNGTQFGT